MASRKKNAIRRRFATTKSWKCSQTAQWFSATWQSSSHRQPNHPIIYLKTSTTGHFRCEKSPVTWWSCQCRTWTRSVRCFRTWQWFAVSDSSPTMRWRSTALTWLRWARNIYRVVRLISDISFLARLVESFENQSRCSENWRRKWSTLFASGN